MQTQAVLHALDLMAMCEWEDAKAALSESNDAVAGRLYLLIADIQQREDLQQRAAAVARHEIGNALSVAQANLEGIIDGVLRQTPERLKGVHDALVTAGTLLDNLTHEPETPEPTAIRIESFNLCALIAAQYATIAGLAGAKNVHVHYQACGHSYGACTNFRGDPLRIGQILRNVLINAVRYTPPGGTVELRCGRPDGDVTVTIRDSGPGIDPADAPYVFEEGYRGNNVSAQGSGLGLKVVSSLLAGFGGKARIIEQSVSGATFVITLPAIPLPPTL